VVAHRAFHLQKRPAQRAVVVSSRRYSAEGMVAIQAVLRFLRFQAPWAYGRKVFVLLRKTPAERWANIRDRLTDVAEQWCVRSGFGQFTIRKMGKLSNVRDRCSFVEGVEYERVAVTSWKWRQAGFYTRLAERILTNVWC